MFFWVVFIVCIMLQLFFLQATVNNPSKTSRSLLKNSLLRRQQANAVPDPKILSSVSLSLISVPLISKVSSSVAGRVDSHPNSNRSYLIPSSFPPWSGSLSDMKPLIIHEHEHIIVVYKPPSFLIQSDAVVVNTPTMKGSSISAPPTTTVGSVSSSFLSSSSTTTTTTTTTDNNLFDAIHQYLTTFHQPPSTSHTKPSSTSKDGGDVTSASVTSTSVIPTSMTSVGSGSGSGSIHNRPNSNHHRSPPPLLYLLHRLDRPCSGVVVFAKTKTVRYTPSYSPCIHITN